MNRKLNNTNNSKHQQLRQEERRRKKKSCNCLRKNIALSSVTSAKKFNHRTKIHNKIKMIERKMKNVNKIVVFTLFAILSCSISIVYRYFQQLNQCLEMQLVSPHTGLGKRKCFNKNIMYKKCVFKIIVYSAKIPKILLSEWTLHSMKRHKERETGT